MILTSLLNGCDSIFLSQPEESINATSELPAAQREATGKPETAGLMCWILLPGTLTQLNTCTVCTNSKRITGNILECFQTCLIHDISSRTNWRAQCKKKRNAKQRDKGQKSWNGIPDPENPSILQQSFFPSCWTQAYVAICKETTVILAESKQVVH